MIFLFQLNVFHWHLSDTQSFPLQLEKYPETTGNMAQYGAYGPDKIYTKDQVKDLITFATKRGDFLHIILPFLEYIFFLSTLPK